MAKTKGKPDKGLYKRMRSSGVRKSVAKRVSAALPTNGGADQSAARKAVAELSGVVDELKDRIRGGPEKRSRAGKKAAATRRRNQTKRSQSAKRGAKTRAKTKSKR